MFRDVTARFSVRIAGAVARNENATLYGLPSLPSSHMDVVLNSYIMSLM